MVYCACRCSFIPPLFSIRDGLGRVSFCLLGSAFGCGRAQQGQGFPCCNLVGPVLVHIPCTPLAYTKSRQLSPQYPRKSDTTPPAG